MSHHVSVIVTRPEGRTRGLTRLPGRAAQRFLGQFRFTPWEPT
jgi:hypothetical protein